MVLFERAIMELSSLTASVTLGNVRMGFYDGKAQYEGIHKLVGLLLLLEDGGCGVILFLALGARSVPARVSQSAVTEAGMAGYVLRTSNGSSSRGGLSGVREPF